MDTWLAYTWLFGAWALLLGLISIQADWRWGEGFFGLIFFGCLFSFLIWCSVEFLHYNQVYPFIPQ